jgi:(1->4)-alpha-D-glucan 1-alpha-D-glucosylmutase
MIPRATLRLQFHRGFTFADAERLVPYMAALGISHLYASPITTARPGSMHGYDVINPTEVNPELGGEAGLRRLVAALHAAGLGLIVDIVPNHMAADLANRWWVDVLKNGRASRYAASFDIDWERGGDKVLLPVLGKPLQETLKAGEIAVVRHPDGGHALRYASLLFPLAGGAAEGEDLAAILERQHYRLAWWRLAGDAINWRRFFDINELVSLRQENDDTFAATHALILQLYGEGLLDGVRVDHVDGLREPERYCRKLRAALETAGPGRRPYLVVEKILLRDEALPASWGCDGTTGYDFMDAVNAVQHDNRGERTLAQTWARVSGRPAAFAPEEEAARREILARSFSAQLDACVAALHPSLQRLLGGDLGRPTLRRILIELLAHFPVYRTYGTGDALSPSEGQYVDSAIEGARTTCLATDRWAVELLHRWLRTSPDQAIHRFQQLSAPVAAKSVEDTAFYRYGRLLSRNDVGFNIECFAMEAPAFHGKALRRHEHLPQAMLATATHDHKHGEDVRARLAVLSERAEEWAALVVRWIECGASLRSADAPSKGDIAMLLQTIVGAWPLDLDRQDKAGRAAFAARLEGWQRKALREAKLESDWAAVNEPYEEASQRFLRALLVDAEKPELLDEIAGFVEAIAAAGAVNGLAQLLLKLTVPGVPDIYQGTEYWDFSLVDPDNRRPVDYGTRATTLGGAPVGALATCWRDGRIKQAILACALDLRRRNEEVFSAGSYEPVLAEGPMADRVVAFMRRRGGRMLLTVVPRLPADLMGDPDTIALDARSWKNTVLRLEPPPQGLIDVFSGDAVNVPAAGLPLAAVCGAVPIGLVCSASMISSDVPVAGNATS